MNYGKVLTFNALRHTVVIIALAAASCGAAFAEQIADEKTKRFQSFTLNGQLADTGRTLHRLASGFSKDRVCLVLFGDPNKKAVNDFRKKATTMLKGLSDMGHSTALLHIDTSFYMDGPKDIFHKTGKTFSAPSTLIYIDAFQGTYQSSLTEMNMGDLRALVLKLEREFMDWAEDSEPSEINQTASEQRTPPAKPDRPASNR